MAAVRQSYGRVASYAWLQSACSNGTHGCISETRRLLHYMRYQHVTRKATYAGLSGGSGILEVFPKTTCTIRGSSEPNRRSSPPPSMFSLSGRCRGVPDRRAYSSLRQQSLPVDVRLGERRGRLGDRSVHPAHAAAARIAAGGCFRVFGGQSVVPWELALFLVEEMKGEGVDPGAVVYTAALAECRWAGQERHVDYILQQMDVEGMSIVPGIPGATDDKLPPSQAPPLFGKLPEEPPRGSGYIALQQQSLDGGNCREASSDAAMLTLAARTADTALLTVEAMWAGDVHEPSAATCRAALDACAAGGQWERALALVQDAAMAMSAGAEDESGTSGDLDPTDVSARVERLALDGKWTEAFSLIQNKEA